MIKRGDKFTIYKTEYMIATVDYDLCCLISMTDGNRFLKPIKVNNCLDITPKELSLMGYNTAHKVGDIIPIKGGEYIIGAVSLNKVILINIKSGGRWGDAFYVKDYDHITQAEIERKL